MSLALVRSQQIGNVSRNISATGPYPTTDILPTNIKLGFVEYQSPKHCDNVVYGRPDNQAIFSSSGIVVQYVVAVFDEYTNEIWTCQMTPKHDFIDVNNRTHKIETSVSPRNNTVQIIYSQEGISNNECQPFTAKISIFLPLTQQTNLTEYSVITTLKCVSNLGERVCARCCEVVVPPAIRPVRKVIEVKGALITNFGRTVIEYFQNLVDMGNYEQICRSRNSLAEKINAGQQDLLCLALLEEADACLTQRTMKEARDTAKKVLDLIEKYNPRNSPVLRSYSYVVFAIAARVNGEFDEAEHYLERAAQEIEPVEACEFKSYVPYNFGTLVMDKVAKRGASASDEAEKRKARKAFRDAVAYSSNEHQNHMLPRVLNRQVSFLLQTTPNKVADVSIEVPAEDIAEAETLLTSLERKVFPCFPTANWPKTLYHLNKCDYYTRCGLFHEAIEEARICIRLAKEFGGLEQKKRAAKERIQVLRNLQRLDELPTL